MHFYVSNVFKQNRNAKKRSKSKWKILKWCNKPCKITNKEIGEGYNIVKKDGKFYIVKNNDFSKAVELTGVTEALVIPTTEEEKNLKYNVLVVKKDGEYRVVDETKDGKDVLVLTGETITEGTTFVLKGDTLYIK